jgi:hypothetical protein
MSEIDILARKGEGVDMNTVIHDALSPSGNPSRHRRAVKLGQVLGDRTVPVPPRKDDEAMRKARADAQLAREEADAAARRLSALQ